MSAASSSSRGVPLPRRRIVLRLLVGLLVLAVLLATADRVAKNVVEHRLAARIQDSQHLTATPDVTIHGFSFLRQVMAGKYDHVSLRARSPVSEQGLQLNNVTAELHGVKVKTADALSGRVSSVPVKSATGAAFISYAAITTRLNEDVGGLGSALTIRGTTPGHATISGPFGLSLDVTAQVADGRLTITANPADLATLPTLIQPIITSALNTPIPLPTFPFNVTLSSAQLEPTGVQLQAVAHNSTFPT